MPVQWSDAITALKKSAGIAVVKTGLTMLSAKRSSAQRMRKSCFGNVWKLQILAAVIGGPNARSQRLAEETEATSQLEVWISKRKLLETQLG
jgi:hypothetical protein